MTCSASSGRRADLDCFRAPSELDGVHDILTAVTPGEGKSLLPVIVAATLIAVGTIERIVRVVPRNNLRPQAAGGFRRSGLAGDARSCAPDGRRR